MFKFGMVKLVILLLTGPFIASNSDGSNTMDGSNWFESPVNFPYISKLKKTFRSNIDTSNSRIQFFINRN
jgi:hypothetical protein